MEGERKEGEEERYRQWDYAAILQLFTFNSHVSI